MKYFLIYICYGLLSLNGLKASVAALQELDKESFYAVMASGDLQRINEALATIQNGSFQGKEAYEGALLMRKSGLLKKADDKLKAFKAGRIKFETAMQSDGENPEFRFLRLTIQEHAPRVVKYFKDQQNDKEAILKGFKNLSPVVQKAIREYSKTSKVLRPEDL